MILASSGAASKGEYGRAEYWPASSGGGFVFCQVHNIQADVPPENILAMYEELGTLA